MKKQIAILLILIGFAVLFGNIALSLAGYNYYIEYELRNDGDTAYSAPVNITVNAAGLISGAYINDDASDIEVTHLGETENITAMDLDSGSATWRLEHTDIEPGAQAKKVMWFGSSSGTRNQAWISSENDTGLVTNPGSFPFSGTNSFVLIGDVTPMEDPGTGSRQNILCKPNSWCLSLIHGPSYEFMVWDSVVGTVTATIDATLNTEARLYAWHNGLAVPPEIILCDQVAGICSTGTLTSLLSSGSPISHGQCDCNIDDLIVRAPGYGVNPGAPGTLPAASGTSQWCPGHDYGGVLFYKQYVWKHPSLDQGYLNFILDVYTDPYESLCNDDLSDTPVRITSDVMNEIVNGNCSGFQYDTYLQFHGPTITGASGTQQLNSVSVVFNGYNANNETDSVMLQVGEPGSGAHCAPSSDYTIGPIYYHSGTIMLHPSGVNWTVDNLASTTFWLFVNQDIYEDIADPEGNNGSAYDFAFSEIDIYVK